MTRLFLVRHGETIRHSGGRSAGSGNVSLNERGRRQVGDTILAEVEYDGTRPAALLRVNAPARLDEIKTGSRE